LWIRSRLGGPRTTTEGARADTPADAFDSGRSSQPAESNPWQPASKAASAVRAAVRLQDRDGLDDAITKLADAAQEIRSKESTPS
jgi:hypothetical protein